MISINEYDIDIARENAAAIRATIDRNVLARALRPGQARGGWLSRRIDPFLVRIGDRASARQANRGQVTLAGQRTGGSQPQGL